MYCVRAVTKDLYWVGGNDRHGTGRMSQRHGKLAENAKSHH